MLLDTQAVVWVLQDNPRLGWQARMAIAAADRVLFSAVSIWELSIKSLLGKITFPPDALHLLARSGLHELAVTAAHARALVGFPALIPHDPFDRMLAAQAAVEALPLLTADRVLLDVPALRTIDATR